MENRGWNSRAFSILDALSSSLDLLANMLHLSAAGDHVALERHDVRQVTVVVIVVQTVSDHELVGNLKTDVIDVNLPSRWAVLAQQHARFHTGWAELLEHRADELD